MKSAFSTLACYELPLEALLELAERNGMDAVEIRLDGEDRVCGYGLEKIGEARAILERSRVKISDLATGLSFDGIEDLDARVDYCARLAKALSVPALRVFTHAHGRSHPEEITRVERERTARSLQRAAEIAKQYGISLWIETHSAYSTGKSVAQLLDLVKRDNVYVIWDIMHSIEFGESPQKTVEYLGGAIVHVHLKDGVPQEGDPHYRLTALGAGAVSFEEIARALSLISYDGYLSLEWELLWHPELGECYPSTDALLATYQTLLRRVF